MGEKSKRTILIVDDMEINRAILREMFYENYRVLEASNGQIALDMIFQMKGKIDIVLLDIVMPVVDGFGVLEALQGSDLIDRLPVIMITAENSESVMKRGYAMGASDIISKPFNPDIVRKRVKNILALYTRQENLEALVKQQTEALRAQSRHLVDALSSIIEFKNVESGQHILHMRLITKFLLEKISDQYPEYSLSKSQIETISEAAAMHDIGKIAVPDEILNKPGKLTPEEYTIMQTHAEKGCEVAEKLRTIRNEDYMKYCFDICRHHHERWDGNGYPDGLEKEEISIWAQVVSLADVYDALRNYRIYKPPYSHEKTLKMIEDGECGVFNPQLMSIFLENSQELEAILSTESEEEGFTFGEGQREVLWAEQDVINGITDRTLRLIELEREKYRIITDLSGDILFDYDLGRDVLTFSDKFREIFGKANVIESALSVIELTDMIHDEDKQSLYNELAALSQEKPTGKVTLRCLMSKGELHWFEIYLNSIWDMEKKNECLSYMGKLVDINDRYEEVAQWRKVAEIDSLTALFNRSGVEKRISEILNLEKEKNAALCFIDLDNFKQVNDNYGHPVGDELLKYVGKQLQRSVRNTDIIGRIGGDEFIILLRSIKSFDDVQEKAAQICSTMDTSYKNIPFSASIGIARYPEDGTTYPVLLNKADQALYMSKKVKKGGYTFYNSDAGDMPFRSLLSEVDSFAQSEKQIISGLGQSE